MKAGAMRRRGVPAFMLFTMGGFRAFLGSLKRVGREVQD
jgi:hypothetical protein